MAAASTKPLIRLDPFMLFGQRLTRCVMGCCAASLFPGANSTRSCLLLFQCTSWHQTKTRWDVFSHSLKQPEIRILDVCECTLISTQHFLFTRDPCPFLQASPCKEWWPWHTLIWQSYHSCCCSLEETEYWPELLRGWPCLSSVLGKQNITPAKIVK